MSAVYELSPSDFDNPQKLKKSDASNKGITIVKYYSPNCIHCVNSQPAFEELAKVLKDDKTFKIAQINCNKYGDFVNQTNSLLTGFNVEGYPTYILFVNTLFLSVYSEGRDTETMKAVLNNIKTGSGIKQ